MALSKHLRERQVPSYFVVMGAILGGFFLITFWFLGSPQHAIPVESPLNESGFSSEPRKKDLTMHEIVKPQVQDHVQYAQEPGKIDSKVRAQENIIVKANEGDVPEEDFERKPIEEGSETQDQWKKENVKDQDVLEKVESEETIESEILERKRAINSETVMKKETDGLNKDVIGDDGSKGKEEGENVVPYQEVDDNASPGITEAAELELSTENKENPKNWMTQANESNEETKRIKSGEERNEDVLEMEGEEVDGHFKNGTKPMYEVTDKRSEPLHGDEIEAEEVHEKERKEEQTQEQPAVLLQNAGNETIVDARVEEDKAAGVKADVLHGANKLDQVQGNRSGHLQGEGDYGEPLEDQNKRGQVPGKNLSYDWNICSWQGAEDNIPCLDNREEISKLPSRRHFEHRERHCPFADQLHLCLVPLPKGYRLPIRWPRSRNEVWFNNVPHLKLVSYKKDQNWVRLAGDKLVFPGGGTQFKFGAAKYIESVEHFVADVAWGKHTRTVLDIGCGVASFGGYLFDRDVLTMSFAPKDEHEAQVQLALERGIPAISAVMGTQRLPFPSSSFDLAHCARCRIHWHSDGGKWLLEVNRVLRPAGYFVWSATPVYRTQTEEKNIWKAMVKLTESLCWKLVVKAKGLSSGVGFAIYQKSTSNDCYEKRDEKYPPICNEKENPDAAWYTVLENCLQQIPTQKAIHGAEWPLAFPERLHLTPGWLNQSEKSLFGWNAAVEFQMDTEHWRRVFLKSYLKGLGIDWPSIRNVMDMKAGYGGFAAALSGQSLWVLNVVPIDEPDTLPVIYDRGLLGIYHDWCESFSTYPRTYDLLHVDHLFKTVVLRCKPEYILLEMDRILRPEGWMIFREKTKTITEILPIIESLHWNVRLTFVEGEEELLVAQKGYWRPHDPESSR